MDAVHITLLGAIAGFTIFLGLPVGRLRRPAPQLKSVLNGLAIGVLIFLLWDIVTHAWEPVDTALAQRDLQPALLNGLVMAVGVTLGMVSLVYYDKANAARRTRAHAQQPRETVDANVTGPPLRNPNVSASAQPSEVASKKLEGERLALMIATGIGLHNFAEGLAIGNSAAAGQLSFAVVLVVGFALHNATEGFGIVAPLAGSGARTSWGRLALLGIIAGGPTLVGTLVGQSFVNETMSIAFLGLAAGSVLYVVIELLGVARRTAPKEVTAWAILLGLGVGFLTDGILIIAGA